MVSRASLSLLRRTTSIYYLGPSANTAGASFPGGISLGCLAEEGLQLGWDIFAKHLTPTSGPSQV